MKLHIKCDVASIALSYSKLPYCNIKHMRYFLKCFLPNINKCVVLLELFSPYLSSPGTPNSKGKYIQNNSYLQLIQKNNKKCLKKNVKWKGEDREKTKV